MYGYRQRNASIDQVGGRVNECGPSGNHLLVTVYSRPWWNWFRKTYSIRCWKCDVVVTS